MLRKKSGLVPSLRIVVRGGVQGVGFRPYVYRLARTLGVTGSVANTSEGVVIVAQGPNARKLAEELKKRPPSMSRITSMELKAISLAPAKSFRILRSKRKAKATVEVLPDLAVCRECVKDITSPKNRRYGYAFTNCTQCGPRFTIIEHLPYDRPCTTMKLFTMCAECRKEYTSPADRRFHAQPNACPSCGPTLSLLDGYGRPVSCDPLLRTAEELNRGRIVAIKSLGGFQLACDATSNKAVQKLRLLKNRPDKPLALMCDSVANIRKLCRVTKAEEKLLRSPAAPIVLLAKKPLKQSCQLAVSEFVAPHTNRLGIMLPYTPLHLLLFRELRRLKKPVVLVMTSANLGGSPIIKDERELFKLLSGKVDFVLTHNRPIANRCDDSVVLATKENKSKCKPRTELLLPIRLARGYTPLVIKLAPTFHVKHPVLAVGSDLKNTFCIAEKDRAIIGPHIGDMNDKGTESFFIEALDRLLHWTGIRPERVACDMHPDYLSSNLAARLAKNWGVSLVRVQHHLAHILSVLAEWGTDERVLGLALDGTGYGTDQAIWGCEFLLVHPDLSWERVGHLGYLQLPAVPSTTVPNPSLVAASYLRQARQRNNLGEKIPRSVDVKYGRELLTSSMGRLFDAVAAMTGICKHATFDGQAPAALEAAAGAGRHSGYKLAATQWTDGYLVVKPEVILYAVEKDLLRGTNENVVAARFHYTLVAELSRAALELARKYKTKLVALSGGVVQNSILRRGLVSRLSGVGLDVLLNRQVPPNDGGICLGQTLAALK